MPYNMMMNGYILGPIILIVGAYLSYYSAFLIIKCAEETGSTRYEDIALKLYGKRFASITSILNLICLIGYTFSYLVYIKEAIPIIINMYACPH